MRGHARRGHRRDGLVPTKEAFHVGVVEEVNREALVAEKGHKACKSLIFGKPNHLLGVENGHQAVVPALSAWADGARNICLPLDTGVRWRLCFGER